MLVRTAGRGASQLLLFAQHNQNGQVKEDEIGRACRNFGDEEKWWEVREKDATMKT
jgi:hypothetical protein